MKCLALSTALAEGVKSPTRPRPRRRAALRLTPRASAGQRVEAPPGAPPLVILPGFGNAARDYVAPFGDEDASLVAALARRGFSAHVIPVERRDWIRVARMLVTRGFWTGSCTTDPGYSWYLDAVKATVDEARAAAGAERVVLVGHSAGGWLGRAFLGRQDLKDDPLSSGEGDPHEGVAALVSLGTPHAPPPPGSNVRDMTGGALTWVNARWPGAYFAPAGVNYVAVGSRAVVGDRAAPKGTLPGYSYGSYHQVVGRGHGVEGDAVVPLEAALLEGAEHVVLEEIGGVGGEGGGRAVLHSMSRVRTFEEPAGAEVAWYGSEEVCDAWLGPLVDSL